ncbi:ABC1 kinase family protein [Nigerium massiliense]|uniref:ABC1 kinase family protein n=1 Tax=Nigerium massiliense TaxID=1522317 RepID=UPI000693E4A9|nr:AarF/ABC1/UbiB kinase family protein [Nigerium massiliense]
MDPWLSQLFAALLAILTTVALAVVARRVLGVPVGWIRSLAVGAAVMLGADWLMIAVARSGGLIGRELNSTEQGIVVLLFGLVIVWTFTLGLIALVALEMLIPTGSLPPLRTWVTGWGARRRRFARRLELTGIALRHGLGRFLRPGARLGHSDGRQTARAMRRALEDAGVTFVKLGQNLATRQDLLPAAFIDELSQLHSDVEPVPWDEVEPVLAGELGRPSGEVFASVDREPLASASVGQVHRATLPDGSRVVVKIQRAQARAQIIADLDLLTRLGRWLTRNTSWAKAIGVETLVRGFAASLREELDYRVELGNTADMAAGLAPTGTVTVPRTYPDLSGQRVLVMEEIDGVPLARAAAELGRLSAEERSGLAAGVLAEVLRELLVTGVFHADLHPGNLMLRPDATVAMLDFGSVGRLDDVSRTALAFLLAAVNAEDTLAVTDAVVELLGRPDDLDQHALEQEIGVLLVRYRGVSGRGDSAGMFSELMALVLRHSFSIPPMLAGAFRTLAALEGSLLLLDPSFDLVDGARESAAGIVAERANPDAVKQAVQRQLAATLPMLQRLPRRLNQVLEQVESGRFTVTVRSFADPADRAFVRGLVDQAALTVLASAAVLGAIWLIVSEGPQLMPGVALYDVLGSVLLFFGMVLALRVLVRVLRGEPD